MERDSIAEQRKASHVDVVGHSGVQPWSAGAIFPCVVAKVERYPAQRLYRVMLEFVLQSHVARVYATSDADAVEQVRKACAGWECVKPQKVYVISDEPSEPSVSYELIAYGRREEYATREDAEQVARHLNASEFLRGQWRRASRSLAYALDVRPVHDQSGVAL